MKKYLIGVDLGTSGTKAAIYKPDGTLVAESFTEVELYYPKPGIVEQENNDFYTSAAKTVKECIIQSGIDPKEVAAIAFDSQMAGVSLINENYEPAARFDSWLDMRCQPFIKSMEAKAGEKITSLTGCPPTCDHGPKILWWKHEEPDIYRKTAKFLMPAAFVVGKLANLKVDEAFIDYTYIHFSGFSDASAGIWSEELCGLFGVDKEKLPRIVAPWNIVGETEEKACKDFGLAPGTIIAAGAGDTAANALGAGIVHTGQIFDVAGTAAVLAGCTDSFIADNDHRALLTMRSVIPGLWNPLAYIAGGGIILRWIRDQICGDLKGNESSLDDTYESMIALAGKVNSGSDGLLFSPHLGGRVCPSTPDMRGAWMGLSWSHTRGHMIRAALESVAFEYAYYLGIMKELLPDLSFAEARVMGGGAKSNVWNQIKADVMNVPYYRLLGSEYGTWGVAMIAGKAAGLIADLADHASKCAKVKHDNFQPDQSTHTAYIPFVQQYISSQHQLAEWFSQK